MVTCGAMPRAAGARLSYDTRASFAGPLDRPIDPGHVVISIAPALSSSSVQVRA